jgi:hypothetical protein
MSRSIARTALLILSALAAGMLVLVIARAAYYPFWAFGADREELQRSWGGPSEVGAIVMHWLVAAATGLVAIVVGRWAWRTRRRLTERD